MRGRHENYEYFGDYLSLLFICYVLMCLGHFIIDDDSVVGSSYTHDLG